MPPVKTDIWKPFASLIPEGSVPVGGWRVVTYIDENGLLFIQYATTNSPSMPDSVAALEYSKQLMLHQHFNDPSEGDTVEIDEEDDEDGD